ncbi:MAG: hypothetical protein NVSMB33_02960 [Ktedonobacteraceae bacterium]
MLNFLEKLTLFPGDVKQEDISLLRTAGISDQAIEDAIYVCTFFNIIDRIADALGFAVPSAESFARSANSSQTYSYVIISD